MTLDEAIKHCEEIAETQEWMSGTYDDDSMGAKLCKECTSEHRQLAELLRELKKYRIAHWKLRDMDYEYDFNSMFGKNPMYYGEKVWDLFGDMDASVEYEVMGYEEVKS